MRSPRAVSVFHDALRAIDGAAFLVARDQEGDASRGAPGCACTKSSVAVTMAARPRLHVRRAAAVEHAIAHGRRERVGLPFLQRPGGHDVRMAGEAEQRRRAAAPRPEIVDVAEAHALDREIRRPRAGAIMTSWQPASAGVSGGAGEEVQGELEGTVTSRGVYTGRGGTASSQSATHAGEKPGR